MTDSDLELLRVAFQRLERDGYEALVPLVHPEFVMETPPGLAAEPQRYEGPDGYRRWWTSFLEVMDSVKLEAGDIHDLGEDRYAVETVLRAVGEASGIETTQGVVMVASVRDSQLTSIAFATSVEAARAGEIL